MAVSAKELLIGAHTSGAGGLQNALLEGKEIGATTIQLFTANQRQWKSRELKEEEIVLWQKALEETGLRVKDVRYFGSQPWPFPHQVMVGFAAEYASGDLVVDTSELEEARWFERTAMPMLPPPISIARRLVDDWLGVPGK